MSGEEKPTYEELEKELKTLRQEKINRQKQAVHLLREVSLRFTDFCGSNRLPVKINLEFDYDKEDFYEFIPDSMIRN